jgi:hypothetical protein
VPLGSLWPLLGAWAPASVWGPWAGSAPLPFLAWSWIPPSSADFGTCPGIHSASIYQVYPFAVIQWGLLHLLGESAPAPEVAGWTMVNVHVAMHLLEMCPIQVCSERWVADSLQSPASPPSSLQVSGVTSGGFPCAKPRRGFCLTSWSQWSWRLFRSSLSPSSLLHAEPKLQLRSFPSLPTRRLTLQEPAPFLSFRWWAGARHLRVSLPLERE